MLSRQVRMADLKRLINTSCWYQLWTGVLVTQVKSGVAEECVVGRDDCGDEEKQERGAEIVMIINTCLFWRVLMVAAVAGGETSLAGISRGLLEGCATEPPFFELGIIR